jgi:Protein of unknown function (DUF3141)
MMLAAIRPELFGPIIIAGSPLSYWAGVANNDDGTLKKGPFRRCHEAGNDPFAPRKSLYVWRPRGG